MKKMVILLCFLSFVGNSFSADQAAATGMQQAQCREIRENPSIVISEAKIEELKREYIQKFGRAQKILMGLKYGVLPLGATYMAYNMITGLYGWFNPAPNVRVAGQGDNLLPAEVDQVRELLGQEPRGISAHTAQLMYFLVPVVIQVFAEYLQRFVEVFAHQDLNYFAVSYTHLPSLKDDFEQRKKDLPFVITQEHLDYNREHLGIMMEQLANDMSGLIAFIHATVDYADTQVKKQPLINKALYIKRQTNAVIKEVVGLLCTFDRTINFDEQRALLNLILQKNIALLQLIDNEIKTFTIMVHKNR